VQNKKPDFQVGLTFVKPWAAFVGLQFGGTKSPKIRLQEEKVKV
jgi:hypothetical protein